MTDFSTRLDSWSVDEGFDLSINSFVIDQQVAQRLFLKHLVLLMIIMMKNFECCSSLCKLFCVYEWFYFKTVKRLYSFQRHLVNM